jgi:iron only hydrogenase large subunit-like protein
MAKCYGFRNIQNVVKMIKNNKCEYVYIEIMACPNGCFNGGGQIKNK